MSIPMSPEDLPTEMYEAFKRVEMFAHQDIKERVYKLSKMSGNVPQMASILKSLDDDTILKKQTAKSKEASRGMGISKKTPDWAK